MIDMFQDYALDVAQKMASNTNSVLRWQAPTRECPLLRADIHVVNPDGIVQDKKGGV